MTSRVRALYRIDAQPDGPAHARRIVAHELAPVVPKTLLDDIKLMVSELVTNGVRHGRRQPEAPITLDLRVGSDVRCAVTNKGNGVPVTAAVDGYASWGLRLIAALSERWGMERTRDGTRVWFETSPLHADS